MNKEIALNRIQNFLDKSSHHKWPQIQEAIDFLKKETSPEDIKMLEQCFMKVFGKGFQETIESVKK
jgi:Uri superfamily endonuclease